MFQKTFIRLRELVKSVLMFFICRAPLRYLDTTKIIADLNNGGGGFYAFELLLRRALVAPKYRKIFYDFYLKNQNGEKLIIIDGGAHKGVFSDVALACGAICHAFEPNLYLCAFLRNLYKNNKNFILHEAAIGTKNEKTTFYDIDENIVSDGASIVHIQTPYKQSAGYDVQVFDFCAFLKKLIAEHGKIHFLKLDIEGAEFEVLDAILEQNLFPHIDYLMVETHERFFTNPKAKIRQLQTKIRQKNATNIYLDWV